MTVPFLGDRGSGGGFGKSDRGGGGGNYGGQGDMEIQQDTIFVSGMGEDCTEEAMVQHFGSIGVIKVSFLCVCHQDPPVWLCESGLRDNSSSLMLARVTNEALHFFNFMHRQCLTHLHEPDMFILGNRPGFSGIFVSITLHVVLCLLCASPYVCETPG